MELALRTGRPADALEHLTRLAPVTPQFAVYTLDARRAEGEALAALGRRGEAEARLREVEAEAAALGASRPAGGRVSRSRVSSTRRPRDEARRARADARRLREGRGRADRRSDLLRGFKASPVLREAVGA